MQAFKFFYFYGTQWKTQMRNPETHCSHWLHYGNDMFGEVLYLLKQCSFHGGIACMLWATHGRQTGLTGQQIEAGEAPRSLIE